jgi:hypothetical protein
MTPPLAAAQLPLDPATAQATLTIMFSTMRPDPDGTPALVQTQRDAGAALIAALRPRDAAEAAYAARAAAAHYGAMECFRRAILPDVPDPMAIRWHGKAVALSRMNLEMERVLKQAQAGASHTQPAAAPALARPSAPAAQQAAGVAAKPDGKQDPMPSELAADPTRAAAVAASPAASPMARPTVPQNPMPGARLSAAPAALAISPRPTGPSFGTQHPMPSEGPSFVPAASVPMTGAAAASLLSAPPPQQSRRAKLLGSTADVAELLDGARVEARLHVR